MRDCPAKARIRDPVERACRHGLVAARDLVRTLRSGLDTGQPVPDRVFNGLIIADLEMQAGMVLDTAPITAEKRILPDQIERAGDQAPLAARHDQEDVVRQPFMSQMKEGAGQIGPAPFARTRILIELPESVPMLVTKVAAGDPFDLDPGGKRLGTLFPQGLDRKS